MNSPIRLSYAILIVITPLIWVCQAWKPIVGTPAFTTTFSLQQSHPDLSEKGLGLPINAGAESAEISSSFVQETHNAQDALKNELAGARSAPASISFGSEAIGYSGASGSVLGQGIAGFAEDSCAVKKYAFNFDGTANYTSGMPELNQFTICFWVRYTNHSGDHTILTYAVKDEPREIQFWIANSNNSSFVSMAIKGQQMYRLNYPLRTRQWHHTCSSWNGKTGEWQVWLKAERIGRGFHNSLVGHKIPTKGTLYSGGSSVTGEVAKSLHFEVTLIQIYRIALSAGKAHRDHKHHHAHHFDHEGQELSTTSKSTPLINRPLAMHSLLANGQIPTRLRINLAQPSPQTAVAGSAPLYAGADTKLLGVTGTGNAITINTNFVNGQINSGSRLVAQQLVGLSRVPGHPSGVQQQFASPGDQFVEKTETRIFFKRQAGATDTKRRKSGRTARTNGAAGSNDDRGKNVKKRELVLLDDGRVVDDEFVDVEFDGLAEFGGQQFKQELSEKMSIDDEVTTHDREPAEDEVKAVMALCSTCDPEPFQGAIVFAWKDVVRDDLDNALKGYSVGGCSHF